MTAYAVGRKFGLVSHVVDTGDSAAALRDTVRLACAAQEAGFDSFWLAQHHLGGNRSACPSPLVVLAAISSATSTIGLGTAAIMAPLEHPLRLAEDALTLNALSGGRLELGLGPGSDPRASAAFGADHAMRHEMLREVLGELVATLRDGDIAPADTSLADRLWLATGSENGCALAGEFGMNVMIGRKGSPNEVADRASAELLARFRDRFPDARVGLSRSFHCSTDRFSAGDELASQLTWWLANHAPPGRFGADYSSEDYLNESHILIGSGDDIMASIEDDPCLLHTSDILLNVPQAAPDVELAIGSVQRLAPTLAQIRT